MKANVGTSLRHFNASTINIYDARFKMESLGAKAPGVFYIIKNFAVQFSFRFLAYSSLNYSTTFKR